MGYHTEFEGQFLFNRPLTHQEFQKLSALSCDRRDSPELFDGVERYIGPSYHNDWSPSDDGRGLEWNGAEKFYDYCGFLEWMCDCVLQPMGLTLTGEVEYQGEDPDDVGTIACKPTINGATVVTDYEKVAIRADSIQTLRGAFNLAHSIAEKLEAQVGCPSSRRELNDLRKAVDALDD